MRDDAASRANFRVETVGGPPTWRCPACRAGLRVNDETVWIPEFLDRHGPAGSDGFRACRRKAGRRPPRKTVLSLQVTVGRHPDSRALMRGPWNERHQAC